MRVSQWLIGLSGLWIITWAHAADQASLRMKDGDHVSGQLADSAQPDVIAWQSPLFATPIQLSVAGISAINFPLPEKTPKPEGDYCFELADGDILFGKLVAIGQDQMELEIGPMEKVHVATASVRRIYRWTGGNELVFFGPNGLAGWEISGPEAEWREEAGRLLTTQAGAAIRRTFDLPAQARFEFELSWTGKPDFELAIGVDGTKSELAYRFEILENHLIVLRDTELEANLAPLSNVKSGTGSTRLNVFLDQAAERVLVYSSSGEKLADLKVTSRKPQTFGGIQLKNRKGNIRLERLWISHWNGELPQSVQADKTRLHMKDGTILYGQLKSYDANRREFQFDDGTLTQTVPDDKVLDIFLSQRSEGPARRVRLSYLNGQQVSGDLEKIENGMVFVKCPAIQEPFHAPITDLQSMVLAPDKGDAPDLPGHQGRIEADGIRLHGCLVEAPDNNEASLFWQPLYGRTPVALIRGISAKIIYRDPKPAPSPAPASVQPQVARPAFVVMGQDATAGSRPRPKAVPKLDPRKSTPVLHLRSGDKLPCAILGVDENGVTIKSIVTDATFVKHDQIKVLELIPEAPDFTIQPVKKRRLLVLPRMQRDNPPTQLIRSTSGDYLRGRLVSLTDDEVKFELRLEEKSIPRDIVARIIWLHADELDGKEKTAVKPDATASMRIQTVPRDGNRLTFVADRMEGTTLSGRSDILGSCRIDVQKLDQIVLGSAIEQEAAKLEYHQWRLQQAAEPLGSGDESEGGGEGTEGKDAALVGKMAPDIELNMLDGKRFRLADHRGKIVILDFWASWCGPCLQAMPQVDSVAHEFADKNVILVAINLEEGPDKVKAALERLKLETTVALDRNGRVSERYGVTSIPQTVIIDTEGKVVRLFVGGGARFGEQVRTALQNVLNDRNGKPTENLE